MKRNLTTVKKTSQSKARAAVKPLLGKLIKWTTWTLLVLNLLVVILYIAGSYQRASDTAQLALVRICLILSLLLIISSIYGLILDLYYIVRRHEAVYLLGIAGYIMIIVLGALLALGAAFIIGAAGGNLEG